MPNIRRAQLGDASRLSALAEKTFRDAFALVNTPENLDLHCHSSYTEAMHAAEISNPDMVTLLCEENQRLVGFAQLRWGKIPSCVAADAAGEIQRLYLDSDFHGKGFAQALMRACLNEMAEHRSQRVWLGVWERNARAIACYRKFAFADVGEHVFRVGGDPQRDILMARPVPARRSGGT